MPIVGHADLVSSNLMCRGDYLCTLVLASLIQDEDIKFDMNHQRTSAFCVFYSPLSRSVAEHSD
jgi:hypothetical protein